MSNPLQQYVFPHQQLMKDENITKLPKAINLRINAWNMTFKKYEKNKSDNTFKKLQQQSLIIADAIQTEVVEKDAPEAAPAPVTPVIDSQTEPPINQNGEDESDITGNDDNGSDANENSENDGDGPTRVSKRNPNDLSDDDEQGQEGEGDENNNAKFPETQILNELNNNHGNITYKKLCQILNKRVGETVTVGSITLQNIYLTNDYRRIK